MGTGVGRGKRYSLKEFSNGHIDEYGRDGYGLPTVKGMSFYASNFEKENEETPNLRTC